MNIRPVSFKKQKKQRNNFLEYEKEIIRNSALSSLNIFSDGLNINPLILQTVSFYLKPYALTFIINWTSLDYAYLTEHLNTEINLHYASKIPTNSLKRKEYYKRGGVYIVNETTLLTDFINDIVDIEKITCVIVLNTERLKTKSKEAFMLQIFNEKNEEGIVKAFTEKPTILNSKYFTLYKLNEIIKAKEVLFYPRFRDSINSAYEKFSSNSKEISLKLYHKLEEIQIYLLEVINKIGRESCKYLNFEFFEHMDIYALRRIGIDVNLLYKYKVLLEFLFIDWELFKFYYFEIKNEENWGNSPEMKIIQEIIESVNEEELNKINKKFLKLNQMIKEHTLNNKTNTVDDSTVNILESNETYITKEGKKILILCDNSLVAFILNKKYKKAINTIEDIKSIYEIYSEEEEYVTHVQENEIIFKTHREFKYNKIPYDLCILLSFNLSSLRLIERENSNPIILYYRNTFEEERYLNELRLEKESFEKLIKEYSQLPKPLKKNMELNEMEITIDFRELNSSLPLSLFLNGFLIKIQMLENGDYILNRNICIERKNIFDLLVSLKGRLYSQLKRMLYNFKRCYLLIEFPDAKLSIFDYSLKELKNDEFVEKFLILVLFFDVKVIYSSDNQMTIKYLKQIPIQQFNGDNHPETEGHTEDGNEKNTNNLIDPKLFEIINSLPFTGIKSNILKFKNLRELISADEKKLISVFGSQGNEIYDFFHSPF